MLTNLAIPDTCAFKMFLTITPKSGKCQVTAPKSISTVGWEVDANGGDRVRWPGFGPTGDAATAIGAPFMSKTSPRPLRCRDNFFPAN
jgi:hypothetical protein